MKYLLAIPLVCVLLAAGCDEEAEACDASQFAVVQSYAPAAVFSAQVAYPQFAVVQQPVIQRQVVVRRQKVAVASPQFAVVQPQVVLDRRAVLSAQRSANARDLALAGRPLAARAAARRSARAALFGF